MIISWSIVRKHAVSLVCAGLLWATAVGAEAPPMIALGRHYALALPASGPALSWGRNDFGQLGNGEAAWRAWPQRVGNAFPITALAAGDGFSLALDEQGAVWAWGSNSSGELGDGSRRNKSYPVRVTGLNGRMVRGIAAGLHHGLALDVEGQVWTWGKAAQGQLGTGDGDGALRPQARQVAGLPPIRSLAGGEHHTLALGYDGSVWAWGENRYGQLGDGSRTDRGQPARVQLPGDIVAIASAASSCLALDAAGQVWAWGMGGWGAIGDGTDLDRPIPQPVSGLPPIRSIAAGNLASLAQGHDGSVWMWGSNDYGSFGDTRYGLVLRPVPLEHLRGYDRFALGESQTLARDPAGRWQGWGYNGQGELGLGDTLERRQPTPLAVPQDIRVMASGLNHSLALDEAGQAWSWGANGSGQLGTHADVNRNVAAAMPRLDQARAVSAGLYHALALHTDGTVSAWGLNNNGELGLGDRRNRLQPVTLPTLSGVQQVAAGAEFSLALTGDGRVWSWGLGRHGLHGPEWQDGVLDTPQPIAPLSSGVTRLAVGQDHALALREDGQVWAWGNNQQGQLGLGHHSPVGTPQPVPGLTDVVALAAGRAHSLALRRDGGLWAWGDDGRGAVGAGSGGTLAQPVRIAAATRFTTIAAGEEQSCAIDTDGRVWSWGDNTDGGLGRASGRPFEPLPGVLPGTDGARQVQCAHGSALALRHDGTLLAWGRNHEGQLADATLANRDTPISAANPDVNGPLDLDPAIANDLPAPLLPPFYARALRTGDLSRLTLSVDVRAATPDVAVANRAAARYNLYVAAHSATSAVWLQLDAARQWRPLAWPMSAFLAELEADAPNGVWQALLLNETDLSELGGTTILLGYGRSADEMLSSGRYRTLFTVPQP